jgi:hypothetical protein
LEPSDISSKPGSDKGKGTDLEAREEERGRGRKGKKVLKENLEGRE